MLINADGDYQGMLSGGCLEGDLAERARQVLDTGKAQMVTYDLGLNDEELWGLGVGCDGLMRVFLQPLLPASGYAPFEQIGAPWLDTAAVLRALEPSRLPGVSVRAVQFRPEVPGDGKFADTLLAGLRLRVTDREAYDPVATAVELLTAVASAHPDAIGWREAHFDRLAGGPGLRRAIRETRSPEEIMRDWPGELARFRDRVATVLFYPASPRP